MNYSHISITIGFKSKKLILLPFKIVVMSAAINLLVPSLVVAGEVIQPAEVQLFKIPEGHLESVLIQFARDSGVNLNYKPKQLQGLHSNGLKGRYNSHKALDILLQGTGLSMTPSLGGFDINLALTDVYQLPAINVYGRQRNDTFHNIPQTVSLLDREHFEYSSAESVGDVIKLVPSASRSGSSLDMFSDDYLIRGFNAELSTNGLGFKRTDHPTDLANVERIEVLKGPASVLFGQMEPGGTINIVTKQPLDEYQTNAVVEYGTYDSVRTTLDVTGPLNESVRACLNLSYQDGDISVDNLHYQRVFIAPNINIDLTDTTSLTVEGNFSNNKWEGMHGGAPLEGSIKYNPNGQYSTAFNPAGDDSSTERDSKSINIRLTEALTENIDARLSYTYTRNDADWNEYVPFGLDEVDNRTLERIVFVGEGTYKKDHEIIADVSGEIEFGRLTHTFILGANYFNSKGFRPTKLYSAEAIDLYNPQYSPMNLNTATVIRDRGFIDDTTMLAGFFQDRISIKDDFHIIAGVRYTDSEQSQVTTDYLANSQSYDEIKQSNWSTQLGLIYDLSDATSVYINRSESFVPQAGTTSGQKPLEAEESAQYEIGLHYDLGELQINVSSFLIKKENIAIEDPLDDNFEVAQGTARSKGFEFTIGGEVMDNLYLQAAYGYTDTEIVHSDDKALEGNRFANVPLHTASLQTHYTVSSIPGLTIGGTATYVGTRPGNDDNDFELPAHTRVDLMAQYAFNDQLQLELFVDNALDEAIFSPGSFDGIVQEPERTYMTRLTYQFY